MAINNSGAFSERYVPGSSAPLKKKVVKPVPKPASYDKSTWDTKTKVSQGTIDEIKKMGMTKALGSVKGAAASSKDDSSAKAFAEGVRRLYGDKRYNTAVGKTPDGKSAPRNAVAAGKAEDSRKPLSKSVQKRLVPAPKPENKFVNTGRKVAGAALVAGALVATRGKLPASVLAKVPGAAGAAKLVGRLEGGKALPKVGTRLEYQAKSASDASRKVIQDRIAKKAAMAKVAGKKAPGKSSVGTVSEYAKQAEQNAARKEIQARMAKKAAASAGKKTVKKKIISNKKLAGTTGASTMMLTGDSVKKR